MSKHLEVEARGMGDLGHPWLHGEFEAILGYMRPCLKELKGVWGKVINYS